DAQTVILAEQRRKKRQAGYVIEGAVREEQIGIERDAGPEQSVAKRSQARAPVEDQRVLSAADLDAGRVAPVAHGTGSRARDAPANPPELQLNCHFKRPPRRPTPASFGRLSSRGF